MLTEITITSKDAFEAMQLIEAYLESNGEGFDRDRLQRVFDALSKADWITILPTPKTRGA